LRGPTVGIQQRVAENPRSSVWHRSWFLADVYQHDDAKISGVSTTHREAAMAQSVRRKLGYDDLSGMPDDGLRREILDGELFVTPSPSLAHQRVVKRLARQLDDYFEVRG
jgi:hypothetical protein